MTHLFLDDERQPSDVTWMVLPQVRWTIVRTQQAFQDHILTHGIPGWISFDNDLGEDEHGVNMGEGVWCVTWLIDQVLDGRVDWNPHFQYVVHSKNNVAADLIRGKLDPFIRHMNSG